MHERIQKHRVTVIGAGICGLVCARSLQEAGVDCVILDRGRYPGGRVGSKTLECDGLELLFDHGAPKLDCNENETRRVLEGLGFKVPLEAHPLRTFPMRAIPEHLATLVSNRQSVRVDRVERKTKSFRVQASHFENSQPFVIESEHILFACPSVQAGRILDASGIDQPVCFSHVRYAPQWVFMLAFDRTPASGTTEILPERHKDLGLIQSVERSWSSSSHECLTIRMKTDASQELHDATTEEIRDLMTEEACRRLNHWIRDRSIRTSAVHRWGFARAVEQVAQACVVDHDHGLCYAGDWLSGPDGHWRDADAAILSGWHGAQTLLNMMA